MTITLQESAAWCLTQQNTFVRTTRIVLLHRCTSMLFVHAAVSHAVLAHLAYVPADLLHQHLAVSCLLLDVLHAFEQL